MQTGGILEVGDVLLTRKLVGSGADVPVCVHEESRVPVAVRGLWGLGLTD